MNYIIIQITSTVQAPPPDFLGHSPYPTQHAEEGNDVIENVYLSEQIC